MLRLIDPTQKDQFISVCGKAKGRKSSYEDVTSKKERSELNSSIFGLSRRTFLSTGFTTNSPESLQRSNLHAPPRGTCSYRNDDYDGKENVIPLERAHSSFRGGTGCGPAPNTD